MAGWMRGWEGKGGVGEWMDGLGGWVGGSVNGWMDEQERIVGGNRDI